MVTSFGGYWAGGVHSNVVNVVVGFDVLVGSSVPSCVYSIIFPQPWLGVGLFWFVLVFIHISSMF